MLKLLLYQDTSSLWEYINYKIQDKKILVIAPSPQLADSMRRRVKTEVIEVKTMASFIGELAQALEVNLSLFKKKSQLMLGLSKYARAKFNISHQEFFTAFNVFTELRGVSSDTIVIESILDEYLPDIRTWVMAFYQFLEDKSWLDEHGLYEKLAEALRDGSEELGEFKHTFIFSGFKHLTGSQVDLIKMLSGKNNVFLPYRKSIFEKSWVTDWVQWFAMEAQLIEVGSREEPLSGYGQVVMKEFHSGQMSPNLKDLLKKSKSSSDIILGQIGFGIEEVMMIPHMELSFKLPYHFFDLELQQLYFDLEKREGNVQSIRNKIQLKIFHLDLSQNTDLKKLKILCLIDESLSQYEKDEIVTLYHWKVIREVLKLDLPRVNLTSFFTDQATQHRVLSLADISDPLISRESILILSKSFTAFKGVSSLYSEKIEKFISSVSPIRRSELEDDFLQEDILELIKEKKILLLQEKELLESEPRWAEIINSLEVTEVEASSRVKNIQKHHGMEKKISHPLAMSGRFSASRLQAYLDCQLLYYYRYIEKIFPDFTFETELESREMGRLEHLVIEKYCQKFSEVLSEDIASLTRDIVSDYCERENKRLDIVKKNSLEKEIFNYAHEGIRATLDLKKVIGIKESLVFERSIENEFPHLGKTGFIDCSSFSPSHTVLIDYKRSAWGIPSIKDISERQKIQLLFYLNIIIKEKQLNEKGAYCLGYLCLGDLEKSRLWVDDMTKEALIEKGYPRNIFCELEQLLEYFKGYEEWEKQTIQKIKEQTVFKPTPNKKNNCSYCEIRNICDRGISL